MRLILSSWESPAWIVRVGWKWLMVWWVWWEFWLPLHLKRLFAISSMVDCWVEDQVSARITFGQVGCQCKYWSNPLFKNSWPWLLFSNFHPSNFQQPVLKLSPLGPFIHPLWNLVVMSLDITLPDHFLPHHTDFHHFTTYPLDNFIYTLPIVACTHSDTSSFSFPDQCSPEATYRKIPTTCKVITLRVKKCLSSKISFFFVTQE